MSIPKPALFLGLGGLVPFASGALISIINTLPDILVPHTWLLDRTPQAWAALFLSAYGAVILSFLGGIRWGHILNDKQSLQRWVPLSLSVVPSLLAWLALLLSPAWAYALLILGFVYQYALDRQATQSALLPDWFGRLRAILTAGATSCLLVGLLAQVY